MGATSLSVRTLTVAEVEIDPSQINAHGGPRAPRLLLPLLIRTRASVPWAIDWKIMTLIAVRYEVRAATPPGGVFSEGVACPAQELRVEATHVIQLPLSLDPYRVKEIEAYRASRDLELRIDLSLIAGLPPDAPRGSEPAKSSPFAHIAEITSIQVQLPLNVPRSMWIERLLPHLLGEDRELVELPLNRGRINQAAAYLEAAEAAFHRWDTKSMYANCREMATALDTALHKVHGSDRFLVEHRWGRAIERFNHLASLDLHLEDIKKSEAVDAALVRIGRQDAEFLLLTAKILLKYANDLLPPPGEP